MISENIEAKLYDSKMYRSADSYYAADWEKHLNTRVLVGNLMITFYEIENLISVGKWTNQGLAELCDILHEVLIEEKKITTEGSDLHDIETD